MSYPGFKSTPYGTAVSFTNHYTEWVTENQLFYHTTISICYKQSPDNLRLVAFSQRANNWRLFEDETFKDSNIINNLIGYEAGQEEPDYLRADEIYARRQVSNKLEKHFLKIDTNSERSMKLHKELRSCISGYRGIYKQLTN
ncbi:uncharacterized protein TNCV_42051 [Trichonephila clavipes]|nr:uncharacterized protein TNCV_42051 [Trichonephila clavipes]